jgi:nuclear pore complex protein Nup160
MQAADVMYQQAKRLEGSRKSKDFSPYDVGIKQASSYLAAINALSLLDKRQAWLANPLPREAHTRVRPITCLSVQI